MLSPFVAVQRALRKFDSTTDTGEKIGFFFCLLPFIEAGNLKNDTLWNNCTLSESKADQGTFWDADSPSFLICPSDGSPTKQIMVGGYDWVIGGAERPKGLTSYVPNRQVFGAKQVNGNIWDVVWNNGTGNTKMGTFTNGTSNTICVIEKPMITGDKVIKAIAWGVTGGDVDPPGDIVDGATLWGMGSDMGPEAQPIFGCNCDDPNQSWDDANGQWWLGNCNFTVGGVTRAYFQPPLSARVKEQQNIWNIYAIHNGTLSNAVFGDGSVRGISSNIDELAWSAMVTPSGGETSTAVE